MKDFEELIGNEGSPEELQELRRMHELLLSAEPPPPVARPLPAARRGPRLPRLPRLQLRWPAVAVGFATAFSALGVGTALLLGNGNGSVVRPMHGVGAVRAASAVIDVGRADGDGNRAIEFNVRSLPALPRGGSYELYLTEHGKLAVPCGVFQTGRAGTAHVRMNAPDDLEEYDGWVVTPAGSSRVLLTT